MYTKMTKMSNYKSIKRKLKSFEMNVKTEELQDESSFYV